MRETASLQILASNVCESYADMQAAAHFGAQLLNVISERWGERYVHFVLDLVRDPVFRSLGPGGVRAAVRLVDDQLRVLISSANAWASFVAVDRGRRRTGARRVDLHHRRHGHQAFAEVRGLVKAVIQYTTQHNRMGVTSAIMTNIL